MAEKITTSKAPQPVGAYNQAVKAHGWVYVSGQIALSPEGDFIEGDFSAQATQVFNNIASILDASGSTLDDIVKLTVFLKDMTYAPLLNKVMASFFEAKLPARSVVACAGLPMEALLEIDAVACVLP